MADRLEEAACVIEELSRVHDFKIPVMAAWSALGLRQEALGLRQEDL
jgi:hypothetical protein